MNDLEERLRTDLKAAVAQVEDRIDTDEALLAGQRARSSRRIARTAAMAAFAAVLGLMGWGFLRTGPVLGGHPDPLGTVPAMPSIPSVSSSPYVPTDPMSATFDLGGELNGQVPTYDSITVSVKPVGDTVDLQVGLLKPTGKDDQTLLLRNFTMTAGTAWSVALDKHLVLAIVPGRPTWYQSLGDASKGAVTDHQPLTGINATAYLTGYIKAGGADTVRGFLWRGADGVAQDSLGNVVPSAEITLAGETYWVYRDAALDILGVVPKEGGGGYSFDLRDQKADDLVHGSFGHTPDGGETTWTQLGVLPPGSHDIGLVMPAPNAEWGSATLSDGWVVILAHATTKSSDLITSITYTGADGRVINYRS